MAEVKYGEPCPSKAPDDTACVWPRSHKNDHRDAESNGRCWAGGIRTAPRWRCPRGYEYAPCGTCPTCVAAAAPVAEDESTAIAYQVEYDLYIGMGVWSGWTAEGDPYATQAEAEAYIAGRLRDPQTRYRVVPA